MQQLSTGTRLGLRPLVIRPFGVLPSKGSTQPSAFSVSASALSAAAAGGASRQSSR
jgi:hypothetical protein